MGMNHGAFPWRGFHFVTAHWHNLAGTRPRYTFTNHTPPLKKDFPDLVFKVLKTSAQEARFEAELHLPIRDAGSNLAQYRRNCGGSCDVREQNFLDFLLPPLFDYAHTLSAYKPTLTQNTGDCDLDFLAPASNMQLHT